VNEEALAHWGGGGAVAPNKKNDHLEVAETVNASTANAAI